MKTQFILLILVLVCSCKTKSITKQNVLLQAEKEVNYIPYYLKVYEADSLFVIKDYANCYKLLDSLFNEYEPLNTLNVYEYNSYIVSSFKTKQFENFRDKVMKIYKEFGVVGFDRTINDSINSVAGLSNDDIFELNRQYRNSLNDSLRLQILRMSKEDQKVRTTEYSEEGMEFYAKKHEIELDTIFKKYGFPSEKLIGGISYFNYKSDEELVTPFGILVHQGGNKDAKEKILPILLEFVKKGDCSPLIYANVYDKHEAIYNNYKQFYNSFESLSPIDTTIVNRRRNDSIRRTIGLPSIKYYLWWKKNLED